MQIRPDQPQAPSAIRSDLGAIFVSMELSRSSWVITSLSPGSGEKMSKHSVPAGDICALLMRFSNLKQKAFARTGKLFPIIVIQEAGLDGFWIHRALQKEGIESHVVDPARSATSMPTPGEPRLDKIDGEALLRALLAYKRGEPRVCAMVKAPTPEEEDRRGLSRDRKVLIAERVSHVNRIKGLLFCQGVSGYQPLSRDRGRLDELKTGDGRPLPKHLKVQISRELDRLELLLEQIKAIEAERDALLDAQQSVPTSPAAMLLNLKGIGPEFTTVLCSEVTVPTFRQSSPGRFLRGPDTDNSGRADRLTGNRACRNQAIRDCEQRSSSSPGYGCAISRNRRWLCGSKNGSSAMAAVLRNRPSWRWRASCWWPYGNM